MHDKDIQEVRRLPGSRYLFLLIGHLSLLIGAVGLLVPVMPSSPFVIIAAACYARSSERFYLLLLNNRYFGDDIARWLDRRCVRRRIKLAGAGALAVAFSVTVLIFVTPLWGRLAVGGVGLLAVLAVLCIPVCEE